MTIEQIYDVTIKPLEPGDRLRLAARILNELAQEDGVDESDAWTEEDLREFTAAGWRLVDQRVSGSEVA